MVASVAMFQITENGKRFRWCMQKKMKAVEALSFED